MSQAQKEELIYFGVDHEYSLRRTQDWRNTPACGVRTILFRKGDRIDLAEKAEETIEEE